jgi:hypothetical protein
MPDGRTRTRANTVVAIDVVDIIGSRIFIQSRGIERRSVIDLVPIDVNPKNAQIGCGRIYRPWNCNNFAATAGTTCPATTSGENSVSHAAVASVDYDVFNYTDFFTPG